MTGCVEDEDDSNANGQVDINSTNNDENGENSKNGGNAANSTNAANGENGTNGENGSNDDNEENGMPDPELASRAAVVGYSVLDRPIIAEWYGTSGPVLYILSAIHGSERSAVTSGERLRTMLQGGLAEREQIQVFFLAAANPDGIADRSRENVNGIDLNRNFPATNFVPGDGGDEPLSEPETVAIHDTIDAIDPAAILSIHCCVPTMDWDGPGADLAEVMGDASGFPVEKLGAADGSLGSWAGEDLFIPTITVEFAADENQDTRGQLESVEAAITAAAGWVRDNGHDAGVDVADQLETLDDFSSQEFAAFDIGESAGGLPIRAEALGIDDGPAILLASGGAENDERALFVAEHIRRIAHSEFFGWFSGTLLMITAANPDGIPLRSPQNADGLDVSTDFGPRQGPEADHLTALVESRGITTAVVVEATNGGDSITLFGVDEGELPGSFDPTLTVHTGDDNDLDSNSLVGWLRTQDIGVVRLDVDTYFAVGDTRDDVIFDDIEVFSRSVLALFE